jgi:hypothetical protein
MINRRGKRYDWRTYDGNDFVIKQNDKGPEAFPAGRLDTYMAVPLSTGHIDADACETHTANVTGIFYYYIGAEGVGPFHLRDGEQYVMVPGAAAGSLVWVGGAASNVRAALNNQAPEKAAGSADKVQQTIQTVAKILWSVGTGLLSAAGSAMPGPGSKFTVGAMSKTGDALGSVMLMGFGDTGGDVPEGPTVADIENAVRYVVQGTEARNDASLFMTAYAGFQEKAEEIAAVLPDRKKPGPKRWHQSSPIASHLMDDLQRSVEGALAVESGDSFVNRLQYETSNPDSSWFILPQLIVGMGLYVHLKRLHTAMVYLPERLAHGASQIPPAVDVKHLIDRIDAMKTGLVKARASFGAFVDAKVAAAGLAGTPEAIVVIQEVARHYYGDENAVHHQGYKKAFPKGSEYLKKAIPAGPDKVVAAIAELDRIRGYLVQDVALINARKWPEHLLAIEFDPAPAGV